MKEPQWKEEKQPRWWVAAVRRVIAALHGGYTEAAEILGLYKTDEETPSDNAVHNRLRPYSDQVMPIGWAFIRRWYARLSRMALLTGGKEKRLTPNFTG